MGRHSVTFSDNVHPTNREHDLRQRIKELERERDSETEECRKWSERNMELRDTIKAKQDWIDSLEKEKVRLDKNIKELEEEVSQVIGWMYSYACTCVEESVDIREMELSEIIEECIPTVRKAREG